MSSQESAKPSSAAGGTGDATPPPPPPPSGEVAPSGTGQTEPAGAAPSTTHTDDPGKDPLRGSRTSGAYAAVVAVVVLLALLVVFIVQNTTSVPVAFLGWDVSMPLAAALLAATALGMAIVVAVGSLRILQLRRRVRKERKIAQRSR
ncbi:MAG: hypothetical protein CMH83_12415 [Nocardioides sp.]|nr:hypothetical protein [Nocardioides sp.]